MKAQGGRNRSPAFRPEQFGGIDEDREVDLPLRYRRSGGPGDIRLPADGASSAATRGPTGRFGKQAQMEVSVVALRRAFVEGAPRFKVYPPRKCPAHSRCLPGFNAPAYLR